MKTVGELKKFLENIPNDTHLVIFRSDMEKRGFMGDVLFSEEKMSKTRLTAYDAFDYTTYEYETFVMDKNGEPCLMIT